jgi:cellobiose epimerase
MNAGTAETRAVYRDMLEQHVVRAWFPRCIDREHGGFLCDFDRAWRSDGPHDKQLEFQARQTAASAELLLAYPADPVLREAVDAGFGFLRDVMWDAGHGGWFGQTDRAGRPSAQGWKHTHGMAYAIEACFLVYAALGDESALKLGLDGFDWIERHAHDPVHGGYFGPMHRDGAPMLGKDGEARDSIGTPFGLKDMNVNKDLMAALATALQIRPEPRLRPRFDELLAIILRNFAAVDGFPWFDFHPDWTPASTRWRPSETVQAGGMLMDCRSLSDRPEELEGAALRLLRRSFEEGRSVRTGLLLMERHTDRALTAREEAEAPWWAQLELLRTGAQLSERFPDDRQIAGILRHAQASVPRFIDPRFGGMTLAATDNFKLRDRLFRSKRWRRAVQKGNAWKDASHEARALLRLAGLV